VPDTRPYIVIPEFLVYNHPGRVVRRNEIGNVLWTARLDGYLGGLLHDSERVYIAHDNGVTALGRKTGTVVWQAEGPGDRLLLDGKLLLATQCGSSDAITTGGRWLLARVAATGAEVFRVRLPQEDDYDPEPIRKVAGLFLVQTHWDGKPALLIDKQGQVRHRLAGKVIDLLQQGNDLVLLTNENVARLTPAGKVAWSVPFHRVPLGCWWDGGGLLRLQEGDLIAFLYCPIADGGIGLFRLAPGSGKVRWRASCASLGVGHSKYSHRATVSVVGDEVKVVSKGSYGTFVEMLDLVSGRQRSRQVGD
jgi:outer membrane protein assembly factor BamB